MPNIFNGKYISFTEACKMVSEFEMPSIEGWEVDDLVRFTETWIKICGGTDTELYQQWRAMYLASFMKKEN